MSARRAGRGRGRGRGRGAYHNLPGNSLPSRTSSGLLTWPHGVRGWGQGSVWTLKTKEPCLRRPHWGHSWHCGLRTTENFEPTQLWAPWGPSCRPAVGSALLVYLVNRLQSLEVQRLFHSSDMKHSFIISWWQAQGLDKVSSPYRPHGGIEHSRNPESAFSLSLERGQCAGLWQSLYNPENSLSILISQYFLLSWIWNISWSQMLIWKNTILNAW